MTRRWLRPWLVLLLPVLMTLVTPPVAWSDDATWFEPAGPAVSEVCPAPPAPALEGQVPDPVPASTCVARCRTNQDCRSQCGTYYFCSSQQTTLGVCMPY